MSRAPGSAALAALALVLTWSVASAQVPPAQTPPLPPQPLSREQMPREVVAGQPNTPGSTDQLGLLLNRARLLASRPPLARSPELDRAAEAHSRDMRDRRFLEHEGSDGSTPQERAARAGYRVPPSSGWLVVEVISAISEDPAGPLDWWLNDSPQVHGKVLMDPRWREVGVGYARGGEYGNYWTVLLGCRPGVLPTVTVDGRAYPTTEACGDPTLAAEPASAAPAPEVAGVAVGLASLSLRPTLLLPGAGPEVAWADLRSPTSTDWLGLYRVGDPDTAYLAWSYVSCDRLPTSPRAAGTCPVPRPLTRLAPGAYEVRLFVQNGYTPVAPPLPVPAEGLTPRDPLDELR